MRRTASDRLMVVLPTPVVAIIPLFCALVGVVVSSIPLSLSDGRIPPPLFALMCIYFWSLVRPDLVPPGVVFVIGLAEDLLSGGPPGLWTASFIITYILLDRQREVFASLAGWAAILGFAVAMLIASVSAYGIGWLWYLRQPPIEPLALQLAVSILFYVPVGSFLNWLNRRMVGPMRSDF
ncbi:MAG TPA: rod shape-determining protein MreD [Rhizomicrobium sp.]